MRSLHNPFFRPKKHSTGTALLIYLLLLVILVLDALLLALGRNVYLVLRALLAAGQETVLYLDGALFIGAVIVMFIHLVSAERTLMDRDFPRPVLLSVARTTGVQIAALGLLQLLITMLIPARAPLWSYLAAAGALVAGAVLVYLSIRFRQSTRR